MEFYLFDDFYIYSPFLLKNDYNFLEKKMLEKILLKYIYYYLKFNNKLNYYKKFKKLLYLEKFYFKHYLKQQNNISLSIVKHGYVKNNRIEFSIFDLKNFYFNLWNLPEWEWKYNKTYTIFNGFYYFKDIISKKDKILLKLYYNILY